MWAPHMSLVETDVLYWRVFGREEESFLLSQRSGTSYHLGKTKQMLLEQQWFPLRQGFWGIIFNSKNNPKWMA